MNKKLAIKGHSTRGKEVIELLEMIGGNNRWGASGVLPNLYYFISNKCIIYSSQIEKDMVIFTLEEFLEKYPYKIGDKVVYEDDNDIVVISEIKWDNTVGDIFYNVKRIDEDDCFLCPPELLKPYKETNMKSNKCTYCVYAVNNDHCGLRGFRSNFNVSYCSAQNVDNLPNGFELQEDGYFSWVNKKPKYPKTYMECCDVLLIPPYYNLRYHTYETSYDEYATSNTLLSLQDKLNTLGKLIICRDAYWKILGEEMGLGKSWEPDWSKSEPKYVLVCTCNGIEKQWERTYCKTFAFPTEEIRDTFFEDFKDLIEQCKELL